MATLLKDCISRVENCGLSVKVIMFSMRRVSGLPLFEDFDRWTVACCTLSCCAQCF